mgnify:FL=1
MNLPIDYLRTFIAVADTKGFTKAGIQVNRSQSAVITPAIKYVTDVIPAKAGIQKDTGCRIMSGMTGFGYLVAGLIVCK